MNAAFALRAARDDDARTLGQLHATCWRETYTGLVPNMMLAVETCQARTALWSRILGAGQTSATSVLIAECLGVMVGFGACGPQRAAELAEIGYDGEISALYVCSDRQGRGIGHALFRALVSDLAEREFRALALWVLRDNQLGRRFYDRANGILVAAREEQCEGSTLHEVAYGWRQIDRYSGLKLN